MESSLESNRVPWRMEELVRRLEAERVLKTPRIKQAFLAVDRADFVPEDYRDSAYSDEPVSIGYRQTISQPTTVAFMLEKLQARPGDKVLDIGGGSGWQAALLSRIVGEKGKVVSMEIIPELCKLEKRNLAKYDISNVEVLCQDASRGVPKEAPFDCIIAAAAAGDHAPVRIWGEQLKTGGRMVFPVQDVYGGLVVGTKRPDGDFSTDFFEGFVFVPLVRPPRDQGHRRAS